MSARKPDIDESVRPQPPSKKRRFALFIVLAVVLHLPFLAIPSSWLFSKHSAQASKKRVVYIQRFSQLRHARQRKRRVQIQKHRPKKRLTQIIPKKKKKKKKKKKPVLLKGQVVDVAPTPDDRVPEKTRFLSEYNTRVKKQTISRHRKLKYKVAAPKLLRKKRTPRTRKRALVASRIYAMRSPHRRFQLARPKTPQTPKKLRVKKPTKQPRKKKSRSKKVRIPRKNKPQKVALPKSKRGEKKNRAERFPLYRKDKRLSLNTGPPLKLSPSLRFERSPGGATRIPPKAVDLRPDFGTLSRISGAPAPDHVKGVQEGDATYLNSRRYVYAGFFNRVKRLVAQHWNPNNVYRRRDPYGNVYGVRDRSTTLKVVLYKNGKIHKIHVQRSSGLPFLDQEAVRAFRAAHPFPNPPTGLLGKDGKIHFRFSFFLQISSRTGFRLFR